MARERRSAFVETVDTVMEDAIRRGLAHVSTSDSKLDGRQFRAGNGAGGQDLVFFGSCSYLGLEMHPALIEGAKQALDSHGSQFSSSRAFVSVGLYDILEDRFRQIFKGHEVVVSPTTTLGHLAALPVLVRPQDAILLDQQVHASVQTAAQLAKGQGSELMVIPHNHLAQLERRIRLLRSRHERIWFLLDGVYSMFGNVPPLDELVALCEKYRQLHLYIDDAHGMSWAGDLGCGLTLNRLGKLGGRMVMATSLAKGFGCGGGVLVFGNPEWARLVRNCGGPMIFSGPIQPPVLGAALASASLHLDGTVHAYQDELQAKVLLADHELRRHGLPLLSTPGVPILFVPVGLPKWVYDILQRMMADGFYLDAGVFPATPMKRGGVRLTITRHLTEDDICRMAERLASHHRAVMAENGIAPEHLVRTFRLDQRPKQEPVVVRSHGVSVSAPRQQEPTPSSRPLPGRKPPARIVPTAEDSDGQLRVHHERDIRRVDRDLWDRLLGHRGSFDWHGLLFQQRVFQEAKPTAPEHAWEFHFVVIEDDAGRVVLATFFTVALAKDDLFASADVSTKVEAERRGDPYYLTSKVVMLGSPMSEGRHLYLDTGHPLVDRALAELLSQMGEVAEATGAGSIVLRDFEVDDDARLRSTFLEQGFTPLTMPDNFVAEIGDGWPDLDTFVTTRLGRRHRYRLRRHVLEKADRYRIEILEKGPAPELLSYLYNLYLAVWEGSVELNTFCFPFELFEAFAADPRWEFIVLYLDEAGAQEAAPRLEGGEPAPVAHAVCYRGVSAYEMLLVGLDYDYVHEHGCYKQAVFRSVERANAVGAERANLGFTSPVAKRISGARRVPTFAYAQLDDHYAQDVLKAM